MVKFIEFNWHLPALGNGAADTAAGSILSMFSFTPEAGNPPNHALFLSPSTGEPTTKAAALRAEPGSF